MTSILAAQFLSFQFLRMGQEMQGRKRGEHYPCRCTNATAIIADARGKRVSP
ncbi:hypothetical protein BaRGS_00000629, partial [Batillaria attramentaria]